MKLSVKIFSSLYASLLCSSVSCVLAAQTETPERWFEVEVILFKQLNDKKALKEQFPDDVSAKDLPQYKKYFDLLSPYLQPNLSGIKNFMPLCGEKDSQRIFLESLQKVNVPFSTGLTTFEHIDEFNIAGLSNEQLTTAGTEFKEESESTHSRGNDSSDITKLSNTTEQNELTTQAKQVVQEAPEDTLDSDKGAVTSTPHIIFNFDQENETLASSLFSTEQICIISKKEIESLFNDENQTLLPLDAFDVTALPTQLNASGAHISNVPYLIANESLRLTDINQRLQWSKEFKPFLHFGWRQVGITRDKAIPIKLFAGEHLDNQYQQALNDYHRAVSKAKLAEQESSQQLTVEPNQSNDGEHQVEQSNNQLMLKNRQELTQLFSEINDLTAASTVDLIAELEQQSFNEVIKPNDDITSEGEQLNNISAPVAPPQPWTLDGFLKVHLDHYLYITADFNLANQLQNSVEKDENTPVEVNQQLINFSQNTRAITGEIHYFDHPHVGMIVQIRRFDPTKPKDEAVTQVIDN